MLEQFNEIKNFLPHREPFLFIDEIVDIELGKKIHCILKNSPEEDCYRGHFPNNPIFPGVLIVEALAQASGILGFQTMNKTPQQGSIYVFAGIDKARFKACIGPNEKVQLFSKVVSEKKGIWKFDTEAKVDEKIVCTASILCADRKA